MVVSSSLFCDVCFGVSLGISEVFVNSFTGGFSSFITSGSGLVTSGFCSVFLGSKSIFPICLGPESVFEALIISSCCVFSVAS